MMARQAQMNIHVWESEVKYSSVTVTGTNTSSQSSCGLSHLLIHSRNSRLRRFSRAAAAGPPRWWNAAGRMKAIAASVIMVA